jgi:hypothetical protein
VIGVDPSAEALSQDPSRLDEVLEKAKQEDVK